MNSRKMVFCGVVVALFAVVYSQSKGPEAGHVPVIKNQTRTFDRFNVNPKIKPRSPAILAAAKELIAEALGRATATAPPTATAFVPSRTPPIATVPPFGPPPGGPRPPRFFDRFNLNPVLINRSLPVIAANIVPFGEGDGGRGAGAESFPLIEPECPPAPDCPDNICSIKFYQPNGACNNALDPARGSARRAFRRLLPPAYADGKGSPRVGSGNLPSARNVSMAISGFSTPPLSGLTTQFVPFWGQFMIHDVTDTPTASRPGGINCDCDSTDPLCFSIPLYPNDIQYLAGKNCLPLVRSKAIRNNKCNNVQRQQENEITSYLDASSVYGSSKEDLEALLDPLSRIGELKVGDAEFPVDFEAGSVLPFTPQAPNVPTACPFDVHTPQDIPCFVAGDKRVNEQPGLTSLHQIFLTHHNRVVKDLSFFNPDWDRERLVNEARRIVSALSQRITYELFLPIIVGPAYMNRFGLNLVNRGYSYGYDSSIDATVVNGFAAAAFRMGHTLVRGQIRRDNPDFTPAAPTLFLADSFFSSEPFQSESDGRENSILRGVANEPSQLMDTMFSGALQNFLFRPSIGGLGSDLLSLNIQRGRDHGLPGYNRFRELCGLKRARTFDDFVEIPRDARTRLRNIYRGVVDDVDLYPAGIAERSVGGGLLGPTFACIISYQFRALKKGDRFWHENGGKHKVFTRAQLRAVREYGLPRLLCDYADGTIEIQPNPLIQANRARRPRNRRRDCESFPALNLFPWADVSEVDQEPEEEQEFEFTPWFPLCEDECATEAYNRLVKSRPDDVCLDAQGSEIQDLNREVRLVRFRCLAGSIRGTDFPPITANAVWSPWESNPVNRDGDDIERRNRDTHICVKPIAIQAITVNGVPARETEEVFEELSPWKGLVCRGSHQRDSRCDDYQVRYLCTDLRNNQNDPTSIASTRPTTQTTTTTTTSPTTWTRWINLDSPNTRGGDFELRSRVDSRPGFCSNPVGIQYRNSVTRRTDTSQSVSVNPRLGLVCLNSRNGGRCIDYEVRWECNTEDIRE